MTRRVILQCGGRKIMKTNEEEKKRPNIVFTVTGSPAINTTIKQASTNRSRNNNIIAAASKDKQITATSTRPASIDIHIGSGSRQLSQKTSSSVLYCNRTHGKEGIPSFFILNRTWFIKYFLVASKKKTSLKKTVVEFSKRQE